MISCGNRFVKIVETILIYGSLQNLFDRGLLPQITSQDTIANINIYALLLFR